MTVFYDPFSSTGKQLCDASTGNPSEKQEEVKIQKMFPGRKSKQAKQGNIKLLSRASIFGDRAQTIGCSIKQSPL